MKYLFIALFAVPPVLKICGVIDFNWWLICFPIIVFFWWFVWKHPADKKDKNRYTKEQLKYFNKRNDTDNYSEWDGIF